MSNAKKTLAERVVAGEVKPDWLEEAKADVVAVSARNVEGLVAALELAPRLIKGLNARFERGDLDRVEWQAGVAEIPDEAYVAGYIANLSYAYRFQELEDGSSVAVFVRAHGMPVELHAFASHGDVSLWHPNPDRSHAPEPLATRVEE